MENRKNYPEMGRTFLIIIIFIINLNSFQKDIYKYKSLIIYEKLDTIILEKIVKDNFLIILLFYK